VIGYINILSNYTGVFELNGITNLSGSIISSWDVPRLTRLVMEDLMVMGNPGDLSGSSGMQLTNLPALRLVNVPRLTHIPSLVISNVTRTNFDFSGLIGAYSIEISGESISEYVAYQFSIILQLRLTRTVFCLHH
jgi:hypothetical protein